MRAAAKRLTPSRIDVLEDGRESRTSNRFLTLSTVIGHFLINLPIPHSEGVI